MILQWLAKIAHETQGEANRSPTAKKKGVKGHVVESRDVVVLHDGTIKRKHVKTVKQSKLSCEDLNLFYFLKRKDVSKACFYHTLNLKKLGSFVKKQHSTNSPKMNTEDNARGLCVTKNVDLASYVGNKVLPIGHSLPSNDKSECSNVDREEKTKGDKTKGVSRMKEMVKWAAASKTAKREKYSGQEASHNFPNKRTVVNGVRNEDQLDTESPKISFSWDVESSSTIYSSAHSEFSATSPTKNAQILNVASNSTPSHVKDQRGTGNWIHTDSEFVVLEL